MVHVRMRHEHVGQPQDLPRRKRADVAEVEEQRALLEPEVNVERRVPEDPVQQPGDRNGARG
jgi:hypothetical protein